MSHENEYINREVAGESQSSDEEMDPHSQTGMGRIMMYLRHHMFQGTDPIDLIKKHVGQRAADYWREQIVQKPEEYNLVWRVLEVSRKSFLCFRDVESF